MTNYQETKEAIVVAAVLSTYSAKAVVTATVNSTYVGVTATAKATIVTAEFVENKANILTDKCNRQMNTFGSFIAEKRARIEAERAKKGAFNKAAWSHVTDRFDKVA